MKDVHSDKYEADDEKLDPKHNIFKNKLGITDQEKLELAEIRALTSAYEKLAIGYSESHSFNEDDVCHIHTIFLGDIYDWAGKFRTVDLSSENIRWCHAQHIESEMEKFGKLLSELSPFRPDVSRKEILARLAKIHGELIVIHPFRDGNGRATRILSDLLLMQAERKPLSNEPFYDKSIQRKYHKAIQSVWSRMDYAELIQLFDRLVSSE